MTRLWRFLPAAMHCWLDNHAWAGTTHRGALRCVRCGHTWRGPVSE